ncbi:helix-turn-helix transcriptional regulator [Streptomyces sp. ISL-100]|nr:helix-turn-helix transcriptional regulator [Streptomyces sp. ISL-100]
MQVARNLADLRAMRRKTTAQLAADVKRLGVPMSASTITKIEKQGRRVTVDELVALAAALDVSPVTLMLPAADPGGSVMLTPRLRAYGWGGAWRWMHGDDPLVVDGIEGAGHFQWLAANHPYMTKEMIKEMIDRIVFSQPATTTEIVGDEDDGSSG